MNISIDTLVKRFGHIKANRGQWETHWQECADFCLPQKAIITKTRTPGAKLKTDIYDSTAIQAAQILAAGLHSYLTNPTSKWFTLGMEDRELMEIDAVKGWLKDCEDIIFDRLNASNFNQVIHEDYINFGVFGTSTLYEEEDPENAIVFFARPTSEIFILANERGKIDTVYRLFTYTARQAHRKWGDNAGQKVTEAIKAGKIEETIPFLHIVLPRDERNVRKKDAKNMPFASLYIEPKNKKILSEGGYEEFPFFTSRFYKVSDSEYAYSPASVALSDIGMLNEMSKTTIKGAHKSIAPPIILPHDGYLLPFKTTPDAINFKVSGDPTEKAETLDIKRNIPLGLEMENQRRASINKAFFVDLFLMLASLPDKQRTATEIAERVNERMLILGPVLGRLMYEKLDPIITRTFAILARNFKLPPPPKYLLNKNYRIKYISPLAKAQRASEAKSIMDLLLAAEEMAKIDTSVVDNLNLDSTLKELSDINNVSTKILRSEEEVKAIREQREQANQIREIIEKLPQGAEGLKTLMEASQMAKGGEKGVEE